MPKYLCDLQFSETNDLDYERGEVRDLKCQRKG